MPDTFQAVAVVLFALLPGGLYTWAFERLVGRWGISLSDRLLRFVGTSAIFHAIFAPLTYGLYGHYVATHRLANGNAVSWWLWLGVVLYVALPIGDGQGDRYRYEFLTMGACRYSPIKDEIAALFDGAASAASPAAAAAAAAQT